MTVEDLLIVVVIVMAGFFAAQVFSVWRTSQAVRQFTERLSLQSKEVETGLKVLQSRLLELTEDLKPLRTMAENVSRNVDEISEAVRTRADDIDAFVGEVLTLGREQASKVDYLVTDTVQKFEQTTEIIQKDVLRPAIEVSSFVKGIRTGLAVLFSKKPPHPPGDSVSEEELFI